jgi:hypothetical protein
MDDIEDLNLTPFERQAVEERLRIHYTFGTHMPSVIVIFPKYIAEDFPEESDFIRKINYTVTHEIIHSLLADVNDEKFNNEEIAHGCSMILNQDIESNHSHSGMDFYNDHIGKIEIVVNNSEEPESEAVQIETQIPEATQTVTEKMNIARKMSIERLEKFHVTID